jgi:hypothetical protein
MVGEPCVAVDIVEGEITVVDGEVVRCDDTLGEQSAGACFKMVSAVLTLLITNVEMIWIGSLPRRVSHDIISFVG